MKSKPIVMRGSKSLKRGLEDLIKYINARNLRMVEIGCYTGESSEIFAKSKCFKEIYCVDSWINGYDGQYEKKYGRSRCQMAAYTCSMDIVEKQFDVTTQNFSNIIKMKMTSTEATRGFDNYSLDLVYLDGSHIYEMVVQDINLWILKIKKENGYIAGHDYSDKSPTKRKPIKHHVKMAVNDVLGVPDRRFQDGSWIIKL